jgi:hypothetical protein
VFDGVRRSSGLFEGLGGFMSSVLVDGSLVWFRWTIILSSKQFEVR